MVVDHVGRCDPSTRISAKQIAVVAVVGRCFGGQVSVGGTGFPTSMVLQNHLKRRIGAAELVVLDRESFTTATGVSEKSRDAMADLNDKLTKVDY